MTEVDLYEQVARYLNLRYPEVTYHFDLSGVWTPSHKARNLYGRLNQRAWPDLFIAARRYYAPTETDGEHYGGLFIELKREGTKVYRRDGSLVSSEHIQEQDEALKGLRLKGYIAEFAVGFDEARQLIDEYLGNGR